MKQFVMLSGLPRSGSQVLSSMLNQHPEVHSTITSPVADLLGIVYDNWISLSQRYLEPDREQLHNILSGLVFGAYQHIDRNVIVDKNRLWPKYSELMNQTLKSRPKIIATVRSIPDILSSFIILIEKNNHKITYIDQDLIDQNLPINNQNRCKILWERYVSAPYNSLRIGVNAGHADMIFVDYNDIVNSTNITLSRIFNFIGIHDYKIDTAKLQRMDENDNYHGGLEGLHDVRPVLSRVSPDPEKVLGRALVNRYNSMNLEFWKKL